jgi:pilus assembly protein CpaE
MSDRPTFLQQVRSSLSAIPDYDVSEIGLQAALASKGPRTHSDLVLCDIGTGEILNDERVFELRRGFAAVPFIAISEELAPEHVRRLVQLNASDWLRRPLAGRALLDAVVEQLKGLRAHKSDVIAFVPCTGGAGATTLAIAAAAHWAGKGENTCLVDLDFAAGACGQYLDTANEFNLDGVISAPERIDVELLDIIKREHQAGFSLLSFRRADLQISNVKEEFVYRLLDIVTYRYPKVVVDLPGYPTPWADQLLRNSDQIILVTERTVPALKNAREMQQRLLQAGKPSERIRIILNKDRRRMFSITVGQRQIRRLFETKESYFLPDNWSLMSEALNRAVPINLVRPRARLVKQLRHILNEIGAEKPRK